jgi:hypothetical protein
LVGSGALEGADAIGMGPSRDVLQFVASFVQDPGDGSRAGW